MLLKTRPCFPHCCIAIYTQTTHSLWIRVVFFHFLKELINEELSIQILVANVLIFQIERAKARDNNRQINRSSMIYTSLSHPPIQTPIGCIQTLTRMWEV